jgi:hypothetical protein
MSKLPMFKLFYNGQEVHKSNSLDVIRKYNLKYCYGKGLIHTCYVMV